jgi:hypothetical protein
MFDDHLEFRKKEEVDDILTNFDFSENDAI